ncbi:hypothetical protein [Flavobacterium columnare]|uniref:hypothetical protein n=1 Tax=Flavobacterium TaxID=237 RepID=UPI0040334C29
MKEIFQKLAKTDDEVYAKVGTVIAIDQETKTCDVQPLDGSATIIDVYLQADSDNGGLLIMPKLESLVCVVFINKETAILANTGEIDLLSIQIKNTVLEVLNDKMSFKQNQTILEINNEGFSLKKENETLKALMSDLLKALQAQTYTVSTTGGPTAQTGSTTLLNNLDDFVKIEARFNAFLK